MNDRISFVASAEKPGLRLPFRDGRSLCSVRDPIKEAFAWAHRAQLSSRQILVIGHGAGFHVEQLRSVAGARQVTSIDFDPELKADLTFSTNEEADSLWENIVAPRIDQGFQVLSFRPAWAGLEHAFQRVEDFVLGRGMVTGETISWLSEDTGVCRWIENSDDSFYQSLKSIVPDQVNGENLSAKQKILLSLRELIE